jgi:hypothetical protein
MCVKQYNKVVMYGPQTHNTNTSEVHLTYRPQHAKRIRVHLLVDLPVHIPSQEGACLWQRHGNLAQDRELVWWHIGSEQVPCLTRPVGVGRSCIIHINIILTLFAHAKIQHVVDIFSRRLSSSCSSGLQASLRTVSFAPTRHQPNWKACSPTLLCALCPAVGEGKLIRRFQVQPCSLGWGACGSCGGCCRWGSGG